MPNDIDAMTPEERQNALDEELDKALLAGVRDGVEILNSRTGEVVKVSAPASFLQVARGRLNDLGLPKMGGKGSTVLELAASLPDLDDTPDEAVA